jgi:acyl dehydratase
VGDALPPFTAEITLQRLVMEAAANRDYARIHHDPGVALASGAPGVYANTTFVETLLEAGIRTWAGPAARIGMLDFAMTDFICVGDTASTGGVVTARDGDVVDLDVWIETGRGRSVSGTARVHL